MKWYAAVLHLSQGHWLSLYHIWAGSCRYFLCDIIQVIPMTGCKTQGHRKEATSTRESATIIFSRALQRAFKTKLIDNTLSNLRIQDWFLISLRILWYRCSSNTLGLE
jgi:hypothetical protein